MGLDFYGGNARPLPPPPVLPSPQKNCCFTVDRSLIRVSYRLQDSWFEMEKQMRFVCERRSRGIIIKKKKKYGSPRFSFFFGRNLWSFSPMSFNFFFLSFIFFSSIESFSWNPVIFQFVCSNLCWSILEKYKFTTNVNNRSIHQEEIIKEDNKF